MSCDREQLTRGLRGGCAEAWQALYDAYAEEVWRCVARRVGPHAAEVADIVQETFVVAARAARAYDPARGSPWVWLSGIARRQAALHFRRKQTRPAGNVTEGTSGKLFDWLDGNADDPAEVLVAAETAATVRQTLHELPPEYEALLVGKYLDGLSLEELAAAEESSAEAVSSKLARARRAFREAFSKLAGSEDRSSIRVQT